MIPQRRLGPYSVSAVGMGCMHLSFPNERHPDLLNQPDVAIGAIHAALDAGITLLDTADIYAPSWNTMGHNELLVGKAFATWNATTEQKLALPGKKMVLCSESLAVIQAGTIYIEPLRHQLTN